MISKELLIEIGRKKGLVNREHIEKSYFQDVFLFNLFKKTNKFVFKGGTCLYKLYGLQRFSEDLDFSLLGDLDTEIIENVVKSIRIFKISSMKKTKDSFLIKLSCKGILTRYNTLRVDVNFRNEIIEGFDVKNYVSDYIDINPFSMRVLKLEEMIAEKIHSLFVREKARDLFDLFFLLRMVKFDRRLVEKKLKIFGMKFNKERLIKEIDEIKGIWEKELRPFVLIELPKFEDVKDYVADEIK